MAQGDTQRHKVQGDKGSGARPLLSGHLGVKEAELHSSGIHLVRLPTEWPHFSHLQPGRWPDGQRQTDTLTEALQQERTASFYTRIQQQTRQTGTEKNNRGEEKTGRG